MAGDGAAVSSLPGRRRDLGTRQAWMHRHCAQVRILQSAVAQLAQVVRGGGYHLDICHGHTAGDSLAKRVNTGVMADSSRLAKRERRSRPGCTAPCDGML